jgi:glycosyltransferase involved in cell wall biosynthesis
MSDLQHKKLCIVTPEYPPEQWGGLARTVEKVAAHAVSVGVSVQVAHIVLTDSPVVLLDENRQSFERDGITVHRLKVGRERVDEASRDLWTCPHTLTLRTAYQSLEKLFRQEQFDLAHSFFLYPIGYLTGMLAKRLGIPSVVTLVGNDVKKYIFSPEKAAVCRIGLETSDMVVGLSRDLIEMADAVTPVQSKARIIYNSVEIPSESWTPTAENERPLKIGCAAIFKYAKGLPYLFKAAAKATVNKKIRLELRGTLRDSERDTFESMIYLTGVDRLVRLKKPLPHSEMPAWLRSLDMFVLPSVSEGCPNILMEAMASGLPCVATTTGANEDLIEHGVSGLLVPWGDSEALAAAINTILDDPERSAVMGAAARARMECFSPAHERDAWQQAYSDLMP